MLLFVPLGAQSLDQQLRAAPQKASLQEANDITRHNGEISV
jgi:hypothetical protein